MTLAAAAMFGTAGISHTVLFAIARGADGKVLASFSDKHGFPVDDFIVADHLAVVGMAPSCYKRVGYDS